MKASFERAALLRAVKNAAQIAGRKETIPILNNVLLRASHDGFSVTATDLDMEIVQRVEGNISDIGDASVSAHTLYEIVRRLPDGAQITIESDDAGPVRVRAGRARFTLAALSGADFPDSFSGEFTNAFTLTSGRLKWLFDKTALAMCDDVTRYYLNGVFLHVPDGASPALRAVATDGHRLARADMELPDGAAGMPGIIIPAKTVVEVQKLCDAPCNVVVEVSAAKIRFSFGNGAVVLTSKLVDGTFPDYAHVIPKENNKVLGVPRSGLVDSIDRVAALSLERGRAIKLAAADDKIVLSASNPDFGSAEDDIDADYKGGLIEIGFNARYLAGIVGALDGETVRMELCDAGSPALLMERAGASVIYVLMPMRI